MTQERSLCACHGEPSYWQKDKRLKAGGFWECPVRRRAANATRTTDPVRRARLLQRRRTRYDNDWKSRIEAHLKRDAVRRRARIEQRKLKLTEGS